MVGISYLQPEAAAVAIPPWPRQVLDLERTVFASCHAGAPVSPHVPATILAHTNGADLRGQLRTTTNRAPPETI
jgi:hypothetical protein